MLRPTNTTYEGKRIWLETDDVQASEHLKYRVKTSSASLFNKDNLPDVDAVDNGETVVVKEKEVKKITTRYTCSKCKSGFESPLLAGDETTKHRAKACSVCGMATVIDHAALPAEPVPVHWCEAMKVSVEEKEIMRTYATSKAYMERPPALVVSKAPSQEDEPVGQAETASQLRYHCNACEKDFERSRVVNDEKTCRLCGSSDIVDTQAEKEAS